MGELTKLTGPWMEYDRPAVVAPPPPGVPFPLNYRLLLHQYNEELEFILVDKAVPNRGIRSLQGSR
jgi:hypothetical protein